MTSGTDRRGHNDSTRDAHNHRTVRFHALILCLRIDDNAAGKSCSAASADTICLGSMRGAMAKRARMMDTMESISPFVIAA